MLTNRPRDICKVTTDAAVIDQQAQEYDPGNARQAYQALIRANLATRSKGSFCSEEPRLS